MSKNKIAMFATQNDTNKYAVCVDGLFGLFASKNDAVRVYNMIGSIDDSNFGSTQFLNPDYIPLNGLVTPPVDMTETKISDFKAIDIEAYVTKHNARISAKYTRGHKSRVESYKQAKSWSTLFN